MVTTLKYRVVGCMRPIRRRGGGTRLRGSHHNARRAAAGPAPWRALSQVLHNSTGRVDSACVACSHSRYTSADLARGERQAWLCNAGHARDKQPRQWARTEDGQLIRQVADDGVLREQEAQRHKGKRLHHRAGQDLGSVTTYLTRTVMRHILGHECAWHAVPLLDVPLLGQTAWMRDTSTSVRVR